MDLSALRTELKARGFDYLSDSRCNRYLNLAYTEVCEQAEWPFLLATTTGTAPLTVSDLRTIESVEDSTNDRKLYPVDRRALTDAYPDLPDTGTPECYYLSGQTEISVYPANTSVTLRVRYWKVPTELSLDADTPVVPARYHYAIVDLAASRAYMDADNPQLGQAARVEGDRLVAQMMVSLLEPQADRPSQWTIVDGVDC